MTDIIAGSSIAGPSRVVSGANAILTNKDFALEVTTAGSNRTVTLPSLTSFRNRWFLIKVTPGSANDVIVTPAAGQTIDGAATLVMNLASSESSSVLLYGPSRGLDWWVGPGPIDLSDPVISGDISFTAEANHSIGVLPSTTAAVDGGDLTEFAGDGALASGAANGGDGGDYSTLGGDGGAGLAAQPGGSGGDNNVSAGDGGAGTAAAAAGPGGDTNITGGDAGADNGGGGANGGTVSIDGGNASGAGQDGSVNLGTNGTTAIVRIGSATAQFIVNSTNQEFSNASNHTISPIQSSPAGTVGRDMSLRGGQGADGAGAVPGAQGGSGQTLGGVGGAGTVAQPAGQGGTAALTGGNAGTDNGGGGNNGGNANVDAGAGTGAGVGGNVNVGTSTAANVNIGRSGQPVAINGNTQDVRASRVGIIANPTTILATDYLVEIFANAGNLTVNLPDITTVRGRSFAINLRPDSADSAIITPAGGNTISTPIATAQASFTLSNAGTTYQSAIIFAPQTGTDWKVLASSYL